MTVRSKEGARKAYEREEKRKEERDGREGGMKGGRGAEGGREGEGEREREGERSRPTWIDLDRPEYILTHPDRPDSTRFAGDRTED